MDKTEVLKVLSESLKEENQVLDKKYEILLEEIQILNKKISSLQELMEQMENKYSAIIENFSALDSSIEQNISSSLSRSNENIAMDYNVDAENNHYTRYVLNEYTSNLAERVNYCMRPYYYDEKQKNMDIFELENGILNGNAERYMIALNEILDKQSLSVEMVNYISEVIVDLADYVPKGPDIVEETEQIQENTVGSMFGSSGEANGPTEENDNMGNVSVHVEETVNPATEEITTHYKKLESGLFFADWVTTSKLDMRIKDSLASVDYVIDEVARRSDISILVNEDNILGIQSAQGTMFYKDDILGGNKISAFLIDVKNLMDNDLYAPAIVKCYDEVRSVERELTKSKKKDIR